MTLQSDFQHRWAWPLSLLAASGLIQPLAAQPFTTIYNIPPDTAPTSIGSDTQLNLSGSGQLNSNFNAGLLDGSSTNVEVNISGGSVGADFVANAGSTVNITGGAFQDTFFVNTGSDVSLRGGDIGRTRTLPNGSLTIYGDEFLFGETYIPGLNNFGDAVTLSNHFVNNLSGVLTDGSVFMFDFRLGDFMSEQTVTVVKTPVPLIGASIINVPTDPAPKDLRVGQTLNLSSGGNLGNGFVAVDADSINISGGAVGSWMVVNGTSVTMTGGQVGDDFHMLIGSHLHMSGGSIGDHFTPHIATSSTIDGGVIGHNALLQTGSSLTLNSGSIGDNFDVLLSTNLNVNGGTIGSFFDAKSGSTVNVTGGVFGNQAEFQDGSETYISGGRFGQDFNVFSGSTVEITGGEFLMDGQPIVGLEIPGDAVSLPGLSTLTGTLEDGSVFVFSSLSEDDFDPGTVVLRRGSVPVLTPVTFNAPADPIPNGVRAGQTLILSAGADVGDHFAAVGGTVQLSGGAAGFGLEIVDTVMTINDGVVGSKFKVYGGSVVEIHGGSIGAQARAHVGSTMNITGGSVGDTFAALAGSTVNISGGAFGNNPAAFPDSTINISGGDIPSTFRAFASSEVNLLGLSFFVTDPLNPGGLIDLTDGLTPGEPMLWTDRVGTLSGTFLDGSAFSFNLSAFINSQAMLTISLPSLEGDLDGDGFVGINDLNIVLANWNQAVPPGDPLADPSGDGFVGIDDLTAVLGHWNAGTPPAAASVPEPAAAGLLAAGFGLLLSRRNHYH